MIKPIGKYNFTTLEQTTIKELLQYSRGKQVESARILIDEKNITDKFIIKEDDLRCWVFPRGEVLPCHDSKCPIFNIAKKKILLKNATFIHYHPEPLPLSLGDVLMAFVFKVKKIIAVFDDGRYSIFCPNPNVKTPKKELKDANTRLQEAIDKYKTESDFLADKENLEKYKIGIHNFWINLAESTGSKYISTM